VLACTAMADDLVLVVGTYGDAAAAADDFRSLAGGESGGKYSLRDAVILTRDAGGNVHVSQHDQTVAGTAVLGGVGGLVLGLFAPPLLLATAVGSGIGAGIGKLVRRHEEKQMGVDVDQYLPAGTSAVVAI